MRMFIRKLLQRVGYDIVKFHPTYVMGHFDEINLQGEFIWLKKFAFQTILDIGANEGQFADKLHTLFPVAVIYSFEPLRESFQLLEKNFQNIAQMRPINLALGEEAGTITFNKNESTASSSFLKMSENHKENFDFAVKEDPISVKVDTLKNVMAKEKIEFPMLIKIDVQGFEDKVIKGGIEVIKSAKAVICEVSFVELYKVGS